MQTRRAFIKLMIGLGAVILPWTGLPQRWRGSLESLTARPPVKLVRLPKPAAEPDLKNAAFAHLERTAWDDVVYLTGPGLSGRRAGSVGEVKAAEYLSGEMAAIGLEPRGSLKEDGKPGFGHAFSIPEVVPTVVDGRLMLRPKNGLKSPALNLLGAWPGERPQEVIMICAHYDHLGIYQDKVYPGANDNASGVGSVLEVMRRLVREQKKPKRTVVAAFWSAEEMGFLGSSAFIEHPSFSLKQIVAVFNLDTVANGDAADMMLWADRLNYAAQTLAAAAGQKGASAPLGPTRGHNSDHLSFARQGIPAATLLSRTWLERNHTPDDDLTLINPDKLKLAADILYRTVQIAAF